MRTKYKFKFQKEKKDNYLLSEENSTPGDTIKSRIFVNTKKNFKKFSLENTVNNETIKESRTNCNNNKINININRINNNIDGNNSINERAKNKIKILNHRNKINNNNNNTITHNKNNTDSSKKNMLMKIFSEEKKSFNNHNLIESPKKENKNSIYNNYGSNRNYHLNNIFNKSSSISIDKKSYSIRNNSIRNYYKNISYQEKSNIEKDKENNDKDNKYNQTKLYKKKYLEENKNKLEKKEKEGTSNNEKEEKKNINYIIKKKDENIKNEIKNELKSEIKNEVKSEVKSEVKNEIKNEKIEDNRNKYKKLKELNDINYYNNDKKLENKTKKEIQVKRVIMSNNIKNRTKTETNFNFLVHEAHENNRITLIFNKLYDSSPNITQNGETKIKIYKTSSNLNKNNIKKINNDKNISNDNNSLANNYLSNNSNIKIKSMKSIYSFLKSYSRNSNIDTNNSSQNLIKDYKNIRNYSKEQKTNNNNLKEKNESIDTTNDDKTTIKTNISNFQYLSNYNELSINNERLNYYFKKNYDLPKYKIICKNNKLRNYFKKNNIEFNEKENEIKVEKQIINNNTYNTTYNIFKINEKITKQNPINIDIETIQNKTELQINSSPNNNTSNSFFQPCNIKKYDYQKLIDFEIIFILEEKLKTIINKVNKYEICNDECYDWIRFYFYNDFYEKEINLFQINNNRNNIINLIKEEIICFFLSYEVSFSKNFSRISILLKAIFQLLHMNYLLLVNFILSNNYARFKGDENDLVNQILNIINKEIKNDISNKENINENTILNKMNDNYKQINNYYLMIIDNLYSYHDYGLNYNIYSFPNCLNLDNTKITNIQKNNIIILFFFEAIQKKHTFTIQDLKRFFSLFLNKTITFTSFFNPDSISPININKNNNCNINNNYSINNSFNGIYPKALKIKQKMLLQNNSFLPPLKNASIYTLVLDLDETLIHYKIEMSPNFEKPKKNILILRPDLITFLKEMKKIYELVLFSYATYEYIEKILKIIESKEKFFDYILDRRHITYENGSYIKNISLIGRELKNIIIIDDNPQAFKLHNENGIFIKPFYGDCLNDKNILKNLMNILKDIRKDVDNTGDIRKSIQKKNHEIFTQITTGLIE